MLPVPVVTHKSKQTREGSNLSNNKKMKRLVAGFCAVGMLATISADEPVAGWNLARWGMTTAEIQAVYPNTKTVKVATWDFDGRKYHGNVALAESIRVGGYDFEVRFLMDDSERLAAVHLKKDFKEREFFYGDSAFGTVKEHLVQKYSKPTIETDKTDARYLTQQERTELRDKHSNAYLKDPLTRLKNNVYRKSVWQSAKAQITLGYVLSPLIRYSAVILSYAMPGDTDRL
jgi:hypothetical protein